MLTALAGPTDAPMIDAVQPRSTRAGTLRFSDQRFADANGIDAVHDRLSRTSEPEVRVALADWLARLTLTHGSPAQRERLVGLTLDTPDDAVRVVLIERQVREPRAVRLLSLLDHADPTTRATATRLVHLAPADQQAALVVARLGDEDADVRLAAVRAARSTGIDVPLERLSNDRDVRVRRLIGLHQDVTP